MQDQLNELSDIVQATFGLPITIISSDGTETPCSGVFGTELVPVGQFEPVMQQVTVVRIRKYTKVKRGDTIVGRGKQWTVDRKLKDDGQFVTWNLHEQ